MRRSQFRLKPLAVLAASVAVAYSQELLAIPTGPQVVNGTVSFQQPSAGTLNVTNSPGSIINWQGFSIGASEVTRFIQQAASSAVLNRVVGSNLSQIYGQLLSNGRVFLINPGGIVVGPGAIVDTAGFVASTLNMLDSDFLAGKLRFQGDAGSGSIVNQGWIRTGYGGQVVLVAPNIENSGLIHTPGGELILAAGKSLTISSLDLEGVQFEVQAPTDTVVNVGKLLADGGAVGVFAGTLRHSGEIRANALVYDQAGRVVLKAQNEIQLNAGSATGADGKTGGSVTVESAGGLTRVAGTVSATGSAGPGGSIQLLGNRVAVVENALVDASGSTGGGRILVGGDFQGGNPAVQNSSNTFVGSAATLRADATQNGDGGRIIVWSDDKAQFYGSLSAQGGPEGGNGGFAEVSGKQGLIFAGGANLGAPQGKLGDLLLDPLDQYVFTGGGLDPTIIDETTDFPGNAATVDPETLKDVVGNVTLVASRYMRITSAIDLTTTVAGTPTPGKGLTLQVGTYTAPTAPTDPLSLATNTSINNIPNRFDIGADITTAGGAVSLTAGTACAATTGCPTPPPLQSIASSTISTSGGAISLTGLGAISASQLALSSGSGTVTATAPTALSIGNVTTGTGSVSLTSDGFVSTGSITTGGGAVTATSSANGFSTFSTIDTTAAGTVAAGAAVSITGASNLTTRSILAGSANITLSGTNLSNSSTAPLSTSGNVTLTATRGSISQFRINNAANVTANATNDSSGATVSLFSDTVLNATNVTATTSRCSTGGSCDSASISLNGDLGVNVGTVTAAAPTNFVNKAAFGDAYADERFENINSSVNVFSNAGPIRAQSATSLITANNVGLTTTPFSATGGGGGIGTAATPLRVDVKSGFTFSPNGDFNTQLTGTGPNNLNLQVGVAPTGQSYTGTLTKTGQINLSVSANDTTVTASTLDISSGFDTRVFNTSPFVQLRVPNGNLVATTVTVPKGDQTGIQSPAARRNCDVFGGLSCPAAFTIEPLSVSLIASKDLQVNNYTRASGGIAKQTTFQAGSAATLTPGSVTLGTIAASTDALFVSAGVNATVGTLTSGAGSISATQGNVAITNWTSSGNVAVTSSQGDVTIGGISATGTIGITATGAAAGVVKAQTDGAGVEVTSGGAITVTATAIGDPTFTNPLDLAGSSVSLASRNAGAIGAAGKPVVANTQTLTVDAGSGSTFNVSTGTTNLKNLTVTASPAGVGAGGLARVTSNGSNYDFASNGTNFTLGGANFPAAVPAAQFAGGGLAFTATSGNLTLNALDFSASNGNFSATTNGNIANITQTGGQAINLGTGTLTVKADGSVTLEGVNAGGMTATNATTTFGSGCSTVGGSSNVCGVTSFTANQTLTDTGNAGGSWAVTSRGAIMTGALQVGGINLSAASGNVTTGAIGTAARPLTSASISTTSTSAGGNIQTGAIEADSLTLAARGSVTIGAGSLPTDQATALVNATNTDAASINLSSQTSTVTVNGVMNAAAVTLTAPTSINTGNINSAAVAPASITFNSISAVDISTGTLDARSVVSQSACSFSYCPPNDVTVLGAIGTRPDPLKPTNVSLDASGALTLGGAITLDPASAGNVSLRGNTISEPSSAPITVTALGGSNISISAFNSLIATPFRFTQIDAGATGSVTVNAPAGINQTLATVSGGGIKAATVSLSAGSSGSTITGPASPLTLRETSDLTLNAGGSINIDRTGAAGAPLLTDLDITRSSNTSAVSLTGFAAGNAVGISNDTIGGGVNVDVVNTSATPLNLSYTNNDGVNTKLTVTATGIATKGGTVFLSTPGTLTTGAINTKSGVALVPDGGLTLFTNQTLNVSGTVDSGGSGIFAQGLAVSGSGSLVSTNNVFVSAGSGNVGSGATPLAISSPTVSLQAFGTGPSGNVFAALTGTTSLTVNASDGFTVSSSVPLTTVSLATQGSGTGPVSLTTTGAQSFGLVRNGTNIDITGVTSTPTVTSFGLNVQGGGITVKGGIAADALSLQSSGTLTLDGSTSALALSNATQSLFASTGLVIQGDVTATATTSQSMSTSGNLSFTGKGTLAGGTSQSLSASGNVGFTSQGGTITLSATNQNISAFGNLDFTATGGAISVQGATQGIFVSGASSILTLQGGTAAGQSVTFTGTSSQTIQSPDNTTSFIKLLAGSGTDAAAKILYSGTGTQFVQGGNILLTGSSGPGASALISTATGAQRIRANKDIILTGGSASGAVARIENTSTNEQRVGESEFIPFCCSEPYQTDNVIVQGGTGVEAAIVAAGLQKIQANNAVKVLAGTGSTGGARIESTSTSADQRIGCHSGSPVFESCSSTLDTLEVIAGAGGATAQILAAGTQRLRGTSNMTITGNAGDGGFARISTTGGTQAIQFFGTDAMLAGTGAGSDASITSAGTQDLQFGALSLTAGGAGSVAKISAAGTQTLSASSISLTAKGTEIVPIANASAFIEGQGQSVFAGAVTLTGGSGVSGGTSDAVFRNTAGAQTVSASSITMNGGHTFSTTGILNQGTGTQTVSASSGITMRSDPTVPPAHIDSFVLIQNTPSTDQFITGGLTLVNSGAGTVAVTTPAKQTIIANNGGISLDAQATGSAEITAGTDQLIRARFVEVLTGIGSTGNATLGATANQWIHTTNQSPGGNSIFVAARGTGTAKIEAGASQLLEAGYPEFMTGTAASGVLRVGDVDVAGVSRIKAVDQNVFAGSIIVQSGSGAGSISELKATNTQTITTLLGGIEVLGGAGDNSLAQIDPVTQTILVNGSVEIVGGSGVNAVAQILNGTGTQTIIATNGDITLTGGTGAGADALIESLGTQTIGTSGTISLNPVVGGGNAGISPLGNPPASCASPCVLTTVASSTSLVSDTATTPILTADEAIEQTLIELTPEGIAEDPILTRRAPVCR